MTKNRGFGEFSFGLDLSMDENPTIILAFMFSHIMKRDKLGH